MEHESDAIARRYANALFEIGVEHDEVETFHEHLDAVRAAFTGSEVFRHLLLHPAIEVHERRSALQTLADKWGLDQRVRNFLLLLLDNERIDKVPAIASIYRRLVDDREGTIRADITSAVELDDEQTDAIEDVLSEITDKDVVLTTDVDESLIGGAVTRIDSKIYDGSIRNQLEQLKSNILQEV